jgi:hypothetical protein
MAGSNSVIFQDDSEDDGSGGVRKLYLENLP